MSYKYDQKYQREYYQAHKDQYLEHKEKRAQVLRKIIEDAKNVPCADCGIKYASWIMQFDHVRGTKSANVSRLWNTGRKRILEEISKCEVVCANCHADRTYKRNHCPADVTVA